MLTPPLFPQQKSGKKLLSDRCEQKQDQQVSCACSFMKIGTMVFLCHDINDVFMEVAKMSKYSNQHKLADVLFALFVVSWFISRMFYFPLWIIRSAWSEPITVRLNNSRPCLCPAKSLFWYIRNLAYSCKKSKASDTAQQLSLHHSAGCRIF